MCADHTCVKVATEEYLVREASRFRSLHPIPKWGKYFEKNKKGIDSDPNTRA